MDILFIYFENLSYSEDGLVLFLLTGSSDAHSHSCVPIRNSLTKQNTENQYVSSLPFSAVGVQRDTALGANWKC